MQVAIMQPYFFPYLGYFSLIKHTKLFILLDTVQFIRHGWIERNRVLKQNEGWMYIKVPIIKDNGRSTLIKNIRIGNQQNWKKKILAQLQHYKKIAPFYHEAIGLLEELFDQEFNDIVTLNKVSLEKVSSYIGINNNIKVFSELNLKIERPQAPDEWALNICRKLGNVDEYWNPEGGMNFFTTSKYIDAGINIKFHQMELTKYEQNRDIFEHGLSVIDVMMFKSVEDINKMLDNYDLI